MELLNEKWKKQKWKKKKRNKYKIIKRKKEIKMKKEPQMKNGKNEIQMKIKKMKKSEKWLSLNFFFFKYSCKVTKC